MKKVFLTLALVATVLVSCKKVETEDTCCADSTAVAVDSVCCDSESIDTTAVDTTATK